MNWKDFKEAAYQYDKLTSYETDLNTSLDCLALTTKEFGWRSIYLRVGEGDDMVHIPDLTEPEFASLRSLLKTLLTERIKAAHERLATLGIEIPSN